MVTKTEYRIKFRNKFVVEGQLYGTYDLTYLKDNAMTFYDEETALLYVDTEMKLNVCNIKLHITTYIVDEEEFVCIDKKWLKESETDICTECLQRHELHKMYKGVVDRETGLELFCEDCKDNVEFIVSDQKLDEEVE